MKNILFHFLQGALVWWCFFFQCIIFLYYVIMLNLPKYYLKERVTLVMLPDSKVHGANMGPTWVLLAPGGPHVGPMNLAIWAIYHLKWHWANHWVSVDVLSALSSNMAGQFQKHFDEWKYVNFQGIFPIEYWSMWHILDQPVIVLAQITTVYKKFQAK